MRIKTIHIMLRVMLLTVMMPAVMALMTGCSARPEQYTVGFSQCLDDSWRQKMNAEMDREVLLYPQMTLTRRVAYGDNERQCAQIDSFISERVDLLIISPNEAEAVQSAVSRAYRAGIPVIIADRRMSGEEWTAYIGGDNYSVGLLMAEWIRSIQAQYAAPIPVMEICGMKGSPSERLRHEGFMDDLQRSDIVSIDGSKDAYQAVRSYLGAHKDIKAIVAQNDLMAVEAARAVNESEGYGKGSVRIMGVDGILVGLQAIVDGDIECTAIYPSRGDLLIETAVAILENRPYVRDTVLETMLIDAASATPLLRQYQARMHDLETLRLVQLQSNRNRQEMRSDRLMLIAAIILVCVLFIVVLAIVIYRQRTMQREIKKEIRPQLEIVQEEVSQLSHKDELFQERLNELIDQHLTNPNLNVEYLAQLLQLDRTQVFRRVKAITGKGPTEYIRERRLIRADEMLRKGDVSVKHVSVELGFASPGYFSKYYKDYFGHLPSKR